MAGIEKICEFSGDYPGHDMYSYKRNHIQIVPKYRKKFRGAKHTLYVKKGDMYAESKWGSFIHVISKEQYVKQNYDRWYDCYQEYVEECIQNGSRRLVREYEYCLVVDDRKLSGNVLGCYFNQSTEFGKVKRKLKRMLRCQKLNVVYIEEDLYEFIRDNIRQKV